MDLQDRVYKYKKMIIGGATLDDLVRRDSMFDWYLEKGNEAYIKRIMEQIKTHPDQYIAKALFLPTATKLSDVVVNIREVQTPHGDRTPPYGRGVHLWNCPKLLPELESKRGHFAHYYCDPSPALAEAWREHISSNLNDREFGLAGVRLIDWNQDGKGSPIWLVTASSFNHISTRWVAVIRGE